MPQKCDKSTQLLLRQAHRGHFPTQHPVAEKSTIPANQGQSRDHGLGQWAKRSCPGSSKDGFPFTKFCLFFRLEQGLNHSTKGWGHREHRGDPKIPVFFHKDKKKWTIFTKWERPHIWKSQQLHPRVTHRPNKAFPTWRAPWFPWQWPGRGCFWPGSWKFSASWQSVSSWLISQQAWKAAGRAGEEQGAAKPLWTVAPSGFGMWKIEKPAHLGCASGNTTQDTKKDQIPNTLKSYIWKWNSPSCSSSGPHLTFATSVTKSYPLIVRRMH